MLRRGLTRPDLFEIPCLIFFPSSPDPTADESTDYVHFMCPYENEDKMPALFHYLKVRCGQERRRGVSLVDGSFLRGQPITQVKLLNQQPKAPHDFNPLRTHRRDTSGSWAW